MRRVFFWLACLLLATASAPADARERRVALVVAVENYQQAELPRLPNTTRDAALIAQRLREAGFDVDQRNDLGRDEIIAAVTQLAERVSTIRQSGDDPVALFYFAGHGAQDLKETSYLIGSDAKIASQTNLPATAVSLEDLFRTMEQGEPAAMFAIIDACRNNLIATRSTRGTGVAGLAAPGDHRNFLISFSTEPGKVALDGPANGNSPFATALAKYLAEPGLSAGLVFESVGAAVFEETKTQFPRYFSALTRPFKFRAGAEPSPQARTIAVAPGAPGPAAAPASDGEVEFQAALIAGSQEGWRRWLEAFPNHPRVEAAKKLRQRLFEDELWKLAQAEPDRDRKIGILTRLIEAYKDSIYVDKAKEMIVALSSALPPSLPPVQPPSFAQPSQLFQPTPVQQPPPVQPPPSLVMDWREGRWDSPGYDLDGPPYLDSASQADCARLCANDARCVGATYNARRAKCVRKSRMSPLERPRDEAYTGVMRAAMPPIAQTTPRAGLRIELRDGDSPGADLDWIEDVNQERCKATCLSRESCAGFTYNVTRTTCILKARIGRIVAVRDRAVTGIVLGR